MKVYLGSTIVLSDVQSGPTFQLELTDPLKRLDFDSANPVTLVIPPHSVVPYAQGTERTVFQAGAGAVNIVAGPGVLLRSLGDLTATKGVNAVVKMWQRNLDEWVLYGDLAAGAPPGPVNPPVVT